MGVKSKKSPRYVKKSTLNTSQDSYKSSELNESSDKFKEELPEDKTTTNPAPGSKPEEKKAEESSSSKSSDDENSNTLKIHSLPQNFTQEQLLGLFKTHSLNPKAKISHEDGKIVGTLTFLTVSDLEKAEKIVLEQEVEGKRVVKHADKFEFVEVIKEEPEDKTRKDSESSSSSSEDEAPVLNEVKAKERKSVSSKSSESSNSDHESSDKKTRTAKEEKKEELHGAGHDSHLASGKTEGGEKLEKKAESHKNDEGLHGTTTEGHLKTHEVKEEKIQESKHDVKEDKHERKEEKHEVKGDKHEEKHESKEEKHESKEEKHGNKDDKHEGKDEKHGGKDGEHKATVEKHGKIEEKIEVKKDDHHIIEEKKHGELLSSSGELIKQYEIIENNPHTTHPEKPDHPEVKPVDPEHKVHTEADPKSHTSMPEDKKLSFHDAIPVPVKISEKSLSKVEPVISNPRISSSSSSESSETPSKPLEKGLNEESKQVHSTNEDLDSASGYKGSVSYSVEVHPETINEKELDDLVQIDLGANESKSNLNENESRSSKNSAARPQEEITAPAQRIDHIQARVEKNEPGSKWVWVVIGIGFLGGLAYSYFRYKSRA